MNWLDKSVYIDKVPQQTHSYLKRKLEENGAQITSSVGENTDVILVPALDRLEKEVHEKYGVDVVAYPSVIAEIMDTDFKPCWISKSNLNPQAYSTVVLPTYTQDKTKMEIGDIPWETMEQWAKDMGMTVNQKIYKGNLLIVMPDKCHYNNIEYVRYYLKLRGSRPNISFITMQLFRQAYHDWRRKFPQGYQPIDVDLVEIQNRFIGAKWNEIKEKTPVPMVDFKEGIPRDYVVIDTEYRNISTFVNYPVMTEVGAVRVRNGKITDKFFMVVHNDIFSLKDMKKYRYMGEVKSNSIDVVGRKLLDFIGDDLIVGHQILSDLLIMGLNMNHPFEEQSLDTLGLIFHEMPYDIGVYNLPAIAETFGLHKNSHHALDDAITTYELFEMIVDSTKENAMA